jgi:hypothetical protein
MTIPGAQILQPALFHANFIVLLSFPIHVHQVSLQGRSAMCIFVSENEDKPRFLSSDTVVKIFNLSSAPTSALSAVLSNSSEALFRAAARTGLILRPKAL